MIIPHPVDVLEFETDTVRVGSLDKKKLHPENTRKGVLIYKNYEY